MNVVVLRGVVVRPAEQRELASGEVWWAVEVRTDSEDGPPDTVPVVWLESTVPHDVLEGDHVVVTGRVRRRFFRSGGTTQSRTEVVATALVSATDTRRVRRLVDRALTAARV